MQIQVSTLEEARVLIGRVRSGELEQCDCPVCGQFCKVYRQKLYSTMAAFLCKLVAAWFRRGFGDSGDLFDRIRGDNWIDVRKDPGFADVTRNGNYAYLKHWGFVEQRPTILAPGEEPKTRMNGEWRPTPAGIAFATGKRTAPSHVFIFDNKVQAWEPRRVTVKDCLGERFNYTALMEGTW